MNEVLRYVLSLSLSGTLLILLLFFCKFLFKGRLNKRWQYYMWLIVIARLLVPFSPKIGPAGMFFPEADLTVVQTAASTGENIMPTPALGENEGVNNNYQQIGVTADVDSKNKSITEAAEVILQILWLVWLSGALILLVRKITAYQSFVRYIKKNGGEVSDIDLLNQLAECEEQAGVKRPVELYVNRRISSPMLIGFFRPCIILPTVDLSDSDFRYTFLHELTHYRRQDMFYKWLVQFTVCVHWFNPFVWLMGREIDRVCELACDEAVICDLETAEQQAYGDMLINAVRIGGYCRNQAASMTLYESKKMIEERLDAIMNYNKNTKWVTLGSIALAVGLLAVAVIAGAYLVPSITSSAEESGDNVSDIGAVSDYNFRIIHDYGVYYILCEGVEELDDSFVSGVTDGCIKFDFIRTDGYTSVGPFEISETLVEEVTAQCEFMLEAHSPSISREEAQLLMELAAKIQSGDEGFIEYDAEISGGETDSFPIVDDSIFQSVKHIAIYNECISLREEQISQISKTVVKNVLESHAGIYAFDIVEVRMYNEFQEDGNLVVDVEVGAISILIRDPQNSPYVQGMKAVIGELEDPEETEAARQILDAYLENVNQYYNVPSDYAIGFCYRVYIPKEDMEDSSSAGYVFYHRSGPDDDPILTQMAEHETFTEIFTEEDGREYIRERMREVLSDELGTEFRMNPSTGEIVTRDEIVP